MDERMHHSVWDPALLQWCDSEFDAVVDFAKASPVETGFGYLDARGRIDEARPVELWISARMTHVFALASMRGDATATDLVDHGIACLRGPLRDREFGGWFSAIQHHPDAHGHGIAENFGRKEAYGHAFVILAAASATAADRPGAREVLDSALANHDKFWWENETGRIRESYDRAFAESEPYRGLNANMHTVEALLATADVTGEGQWLIRAVDILEFACDQAFAHDWRLPEHYNVSWEVVEDYNADNPADPFRPYGITPGLAFAWSRLMVQAHGALVARGHDAPDWLLPAAVSLFMGAVEDAWEVDGAPGFIYTTDFDGRPMVRDRMHWVLCEAVAAAIALVNEGIDEGGPDLVDEWIQYAKRYFIEAPGRWIHELGEDNGPSVRTWAGKPDAYHVAQMTLMPTTPTHLSFAAALARK